jgi:hypothetical protein
MTQKLDFVNLLLGSGTPKTSNFDTIQGTVISLIRQLVPALIH